MRRSEGAETATAGRLATGEMRSTSVIERWQRRGLRLAVTAEQRGLEKYRILDLKRRRAQIRARRELRLL